MHRLLASSSVLRHGRSSAARFLQTTSANRDHNSQLNSRTEFRSKMALSSRERLKLNLILKCPEQLGKLRRLCDERQTKYELLSGDGCKLQLISEKPDEMSIVETEIRRMLSQIKTFDFEISHGVKVLLNFRSLLDFGQEWVEVEPRGRNMQDEYVFSASGSAEALASFKRNLNMKINTIRYLEMPLPDYVPIETSLLEIVKAVNKQPNTVCFVMDRVVKCWNLDKDKQADIRKDFQAEVDSWSGQYEEDWGASDLMVRYVRNYLNHNKIQDQETELMAMPGYDESYVPVKIKGMKHPVKKLAAAIKRVEREAAYINIPIPSEIMNSVALSQFGSYWRSFTKEILVVLPTETNPSLILVGPFDCVNHRLLYFYRILRANHPDSFKLMQPSIVFKYNDANQFKYDEDGIIMQLKQEYPSASFSRDTTSEPTDVSPPVTLHVSSSLDELVEIDSVLKAQVPVCLGPAYQNAGKICKVLKENNIVDATILIESYGGSSSTILKCSEPRHARQARDEIVRRMEEGDRYRYFPLKQEQHVLVSDRLVQDIKEFADSFAMPISISTYEHEKKSCLARVEGVGDFGKYLKMRNFCNEKFNFDKNRLIDTSLAQSLSSEDFSVWLQNCHEEILKDLDGPVFLFQHDNNWFIGGDEDYFDRASELFNTAIDSLVHRTLQITRKSDDIDMSELESSWPLVKFWKTNSRNTTLLNIVGDKSSVEAIVQKLPHESVGTYTRTIPLPLIGYPYLKYVGKKMFHLPGENPSVRTWPSQFPEANCQIRVTTTPTWSIHLRGDQEEVEKAETKLHEMFDTILYRHVYLDLDEEEPKLKRLNDALLSFGVLRGVVDDAEVSVSVDIGEGQLKFTVLGENDEKLELATEKLKKMCEMFKVEEIRLGDNDHLISNTHIAWRVNLMINPIKSFNVKYQINRKEGVITIFGVSEDVDKCADKLRNILADSTNTTLDVSEDYLGLYIGNLLRHHYFRNIYPDLRLFYRVENKSLDINGPKSKVEEFKQFLKDLHQETYKIDDHYQRFVELYKRLRPLATGVLIVEEKDRTLRLLGSRENVSSLVQMLDYVLGKKKSCYFDLFIDNRQKRVHLETVTHLVTRSASEKFPDISWWLLGNQLRFSGPETQAARAFQFFNKRNRKRDQAQSPGTPTSDSKLIPLSEDSQVKVKLKDIDD